MRHHAFAIEAGAEEGIERALAWAKQELGMASKSNPDIVVLRYSLFSVEDARQVAGVAAQGPAAAAAKVIVIAASRAYREAQNALLKLFEEPPPDTYLFLVLPSLGGLLPTLRSRVQTLRFSGEKRPSDLPRIAREFMDAGKEKRALIAKRLASGKDEEARRKNRDEAIAIADGLEAAAYAQFRKSHSATLSALLGELQTLRGYLHDRSAPVRMVLEHLALVAPGDLLK